MHIAVAWSSVKTSFSPLEKLNNTWRMDCTVRRKGGGHVQSSSPVIDASVSFSIFSKQFAFWRSLQLTLFLALDGIFPFWGRETCSDQIDKKLIHYLVQASNKRLPAVFRCSSRKQELKGVAPSIK